MKKETIKKVGKKVGKYALLTTAAVGVVVVGTVVIYQPKTGKQCRRALFRSDNIPKKAFNSRIRANFQSLIQLVKHRELCIPYKIGDKYYTGHNRELNNKIKQGLDTVNNAIKESIEPRNVQVIAQTIMSKDTRSYFDIEEEEYDNMSEEEQEQIDENQLDVMDDIMFPDGHDDDD